jgi:hypothetical protein
MDQYYEMGLTKTKNNHFKNKYSETQVNHMLRDGCPNPNSYYYYLFFKRGEVGESKALASAQALSAPCFPNILLY